MTITLDDTPCGLNIATDSLDSPNLTITITWLLKESFINVIFDMTSAPHVEYSDVVPCGAFVVINNYPMGGLATITNSMTLLRNLNYKQTLQMTPIWNGFHLIVFMMGNMVYTYMVYQLLGALNGFRLR